MAEEAAEETTETEAEQSDSAGTEDIERLNKALAAERKIRSTAEKQVKELSVKLESLEGQVPTLQKELLTERRKTFAVTKDVPVEAITGDTPEEWEAAAEKLLAWRADQAKPAEKPAKTTSSTSLKSGATGSDSRLDPQERAAAALRQMRHQ
jgi:uncharacterized coiled-coil protein SlyX